MRWGAAGTIAATRLAIDHGLTINLSGGYHHAKPAGGEGFCIYADVGLAIDSLRRDGLLDCDVPLTDAATEQEYMRALESRLPAFLDNVGKARSVRLAIYNAGTDIYEHDALGGLHVSSQGIIDRDWFVVEQLLARNIPTVMLLSGGYHRDSYKIIADSLVNILKRTHRNST
jgi:histone deacetylase 11